MSSSAISRFTSSRARARFQACYRATAERLLPADHRIQDVTTRFGTTRAYRTGPATGVPLVLLPGAGGSALMWHRHLSCWSPHRPVLALDPIGEPGGSVQTASIADGPEQARWLEEVLAGLHVPRAHLVGCSYGGWVALQHHLLHPGRAATLTFLDPAGFGPLTPRFLLWLLLGGLAGLTPRRVRHVAAGALPNATLLDDDLLPLVRHLASFRRRLPTPGTVSDQELAAVNVPALFLLGGRSLMFDPVRVAARIRHLVPSATVEIVADAGHDLAVHHPARVAARIEDFLALSASL